MGDLYQRVADTLLDFLCDLYGITWTIQYLMDSGFSDEQILRLGFQKCDIEDAKELKEEK